MVVLDEVKYAHYLQCLTDGNELERLLYLWRSSQGGPTRAERFSLMGRIVADHSPGSPCILDLFCGPGDVGRALAEHCDAARVVCADRDPFLLAMCTATNRRRRIQSKEHLRDAWDDEWHHGVGQQFDVVASATALHWLDVDRLLHVARDVLHLLRPGGLFVFNEPAAAPCGGLAREHLSSLCAAQDSEASAGAWTQFWTLAHERFGHQPKHSRHDSIGDDGLTVSRYLAVLKEAGFSEVDVAHRHGTDLVIAALKS